MKKTTNVLSMALSLVLVGGACLSSIASANSPGTASHNLSQPLFVEGGSDHLLQNHVAEGGSDRLQERRESMAAVSPSNAIGYSLTVA
ncbi:phage infection protein [Pseudomonas fluorescens]|jgi:hypothetical protein|uniref:phage infection protein n=1 Tax=Pseudomonas fluorescens TaxID=294 RepID=UPI00382BFDA5